MIVKLLTEHHFGVSKLQRKLQRFVRVYNCQNVKLLEFSCRGSCVPVPLPLCTRICENDFHCHIFGKMGSNKAIITTPMHVWLCTFQLMLVGTKLSAWKIFFCFVFVAAVFLFDFYCLFNKVVYFLFSV